jgi:hypothetical protein
LTRPIPAAPPAPRRRRSEDTGKAAFQRAAKNIVRRAVRLPVDAFSAATGYLWDTLDWLNQWHSDPLDPSDPANDVGEDIQAGPSNHLSLH